MLLQLSIRNFTLIDQLDIELDKGMTVISGETGAGKSILLDALGLTLGDRADADMIRAGTEKADICAHFSLQQVPCASQWLSANDFDDSADCILRRVVSSNGRSRAYINGQPVTAQQLRALGSLLIDIHGQHEHQRLLKKENHGELVDLFGNHLELVEQTNNSFRTWQQQQKRLQTLSEQSEEQHAQLQLLRYQVDELDQLNLQPGELEALEQEQQQLGSASEILSTGEWARELTTEGEEGSIRQQLNQVLQQLEQLQLNNPDWGTIQELLNGSLIQIEEASAELEHFLSRIEVDPQRLKLVEERLSSCYHIARKHLCSPNELLDVHQQLSDQLAGLDQGEGGLDALATEVEELQQQFLQQATQLTAARKKAASRLTESVSQQLTLLGMPSCRFEISLAVSEATAKGLENIEFLISTNPGQPPKPLGKIASGGELSRISLAIQVATAQVSAMPVLAFDEVDVGIGGAIAEVVGKLLRELGEHSQVLCVTHQPQVASCGHNHLHVQKQSDEQQSFSQIVKLDPDTRINEIARMLGGIEITQRSLDHAAEMLTSASQAA